MTITNIGAIIKTRKYKLMEVTSARLIFPKKEEGEYYSIIPLFDDTILKIKKIEENNYTIFVNNIDSILTKEVKKNGIMTMNPIYRGLNVLVFPAPVE